MSDTTRRAFLTTSAMAAAAMAAAPAIEPHPRLYYRAGDLPRLRKLRNSGVHARVWANMRASADEYLSLDPPAKIPHGDPNILYHDLYVMFYHALETMAMLEQMSFCYVISEDERYFRKAQSWMNAIHEWERGWGTPYLFSRYLHSIAVFYDCCYSRLEEPERARIRLLLTDQLKAYEKEVFQPHLGDPAFATHHATIYFGCGGVAALALLGEVPEAARWVDVVKQQFADAILPFGYGVDGGQEEGKTFWASQNLYRFFFLDALKNTTGEDWYQKYREHVEPPVDYGIQSFLGGEIADKEYFDACENIAFSADYGQLNYYAPPLLRLASTYRNKQAQWVALRDKNLGRIQKSHSGVPGIGQKVLFCQGPYAYLWLDETLAAERPDSQPLARRFRDVEQVIMRSSWDEDAFIVGLEGRSRGSAAVTDFMLHYAGKTIVSYQYLEGKNVPFNQVAPNTLSFRGLDQLDARVGDFFTSPLHHYAMLEAERYRRHVFFLLPDLVVMVDEVSIQDIPAEEVRWELRSLGDMRVTGPGVVELSVDQARLQMLTMYPPNPEYRVARSPMSKTTGGGNVKLTNEDPREFPRLDFALQPERKSLQPLMPMVITAFHPAAAKMPIKGGVEGGAAYTRAERDGAVTMAMVTRDRVARLEDVYTNAKACVVRRRGTECEAFAIHGGSVILDRGRPLFSSNDRASIALIAGAGGWTGSIVAPQSLRAEMAIDEPREVRIDGQASKFTYKAGKLAIGLPAGLHTLAISRGR